MTSTVKWNVVISPESPIKIFLKNNEKDTATVYSLRITNTIGKRSRTQILAVYNDDNYNSLHSLFDAMTENKGIRTSQPWKNLQFCDDDGNVKSLSFLRNEKVPAYSTLGMRINGIYRINNDYQYLIQDDEPGSVRWISETELADLYPQPKDRQSWVNKFSARVKTRLTPDIPVSVTKSLVKGVQCDATGRMLWMLRDTGDWEAVKGNTNATEILAFIHAIPQLCPVDTPFLCLKGKATDWFQEEVDYLSNCGNKRIANLLKMYI